MNRYIVVLLAGLASSTIYPRCDFFSQMFMFTHPAFMRLPMQQALWHDLIHHIYPECRTSVQMIGFYQSSKPSKGAARYFLPDPCKDDVLVLGDDNPDILTRDVRAEWLGINNPQFRGNYTVCPCQKQMGFLIEGNCTIDEWLPCYWTKGCWASVSLPLVAIENSLQPRQWGISHKGTGAVPDLITAFNQEDWRFAKIDPNGCSTVRFSELNIRFGQNYLDCDHFEVVYYSGLRIPLHGSVDWDHLFNPMIGFNGHVGLDVGASFQLTLNKDTTYRALCFVVNLEGIFLFRDTQCRTLDLVGKPWSRYLLLTRKDGPPNLQVPAMNILTMPVRVRPYGVFDFAAGWRVIYPCWELEFGYNLWGKASERITLRSCANEFLNYGIAGVGPLDPDAPILTASSASESTIAQQAPNDVDKHGNPVFVTLCFGDLNLLSAAARSIINHSGYVSYGYVFHREKCDGFVGFGGFCEIPQRNSALVLFGLWIKGGISF